MSTDAPSDSNQDDALRAAFVEMLFALAVSQVAIYAADLVGVSATSSKKLPAITHLAVGLLLIATSWVGWRQSQSPGMKDKVAFICSLPFVGLLLDVLLVVLYFIVVRTVEIDEAAGVTNLTAASAVPESRWISVVFAVYLVWDLLADVFSKGCIPAGHLRTRASKRLRVAIVSVFSSAICLLLSCATYWAATVSNDKIEILFLDGMLASVIVLFRVLKAFENPLSRWLVVTDCKAFMVSRTTKGDELWWGIGLLLLYIVCAAGASNFDVHQMVAKIRP